MLLMQSVSTPDMGHGTSSQPNNHLLPAVMLSWLTRTQVTSLWAMSFSQKVLFPLPGGPLSSSKTGTPAFAFSEAASSAEDASIAPVPVNDSVTASGFAAAGNATFTADDASVVAAVAGSDSASASVSILAGNVIFLAEDTSVAAVAGSDSMTASGFVFAGNVISTAEDASVAAAAVMTGFADECDAACMPDCEVWLLFCVL